MEEKYKQKLLGLAKKTIEEYAFNGKIFEIDESEIDFFLRERRGVFVTLHIEGQLRGCIGYILPYKPLYMAVIENAYNAAFQDPRFMPVSEKEVAQLEFEISVLSVPEKVKSYKDIIIGKHGIILKSGIYNSVFLPQVASENNWDLETTLTHLSNKSGGLSDLWKNESTEFEIFTAEVFRDAV